MQHAWHSPRSHTWASIFKAVVIVTVLARCANCSADGEMPHQLTSHLGNCSYDLCFLTTACCRHCASGVQRQHNQLCCCQRSELFPGLGEWHGPLPRLDRRHLQHSGSGHQLVSSNSSLVLLLESVVCNRSCCNTPFASAMPLLVLSCEVCAVFPKCFQIAGT